MDKSTITLLSTAFAAIVSATMWVDYFRRIDVFKRGKIGPLIIALLIGCLTPAISLYFYSLLYNVGFLENGKFINDIIYSIIGVGLNEELSKIIGVILVLTIFRNKLDEPIDIFIFAGVTAIGFAMIENFKYFSLYGIKIITPRTFYSSLEHIINTTIIVYGFYRYKIFNKGNHYINIIVSVSLAIASHGLFDFFLMDNFLGYFTVFISIIIYLFGINFWIQMLNNANNYSIFFDYDKIHFNEKIFFRLLFWYSLTVFITFVNNFFVTNIKSAISYFFFGLLSDGFLFLVVMLSASRFKIYKLKYINVTIQFPFYITKNGDEDFLIPFIKLPIKIRGENYKEHIPTKYIDRNILICPVNKNNSFLQKSIRATITNKYLLFDDVVVYSVLFDKSFSDQATLFLLKPITRGETKINGYPIQELYKINDDNKDISTIKLQSLTFLELIYIKY